MKSYSFPPIATNHAKILILGTMPGKTSLEINEYYGFKNNTFWKIMFELFKTNFLNSYNDKVNLLKSNDIALWDSLKYCERKGSLDSSIKEEFPNNFDLFFQNHSKINDILFNGKASYYYFKKYIMLKKKLNFHILPSTSPANASKTYTDKLNEWKIILKILDKNQ